MKHRRQAWRGVTAAVTLLLSGIMSHAGPSAWQLFSFVADYPLGDAVNRIDYQSIEPVAGRLYIAKMGAGQLLVFDIEHNKLVNALDGFPKATGVLVVPGLHKVYVSAPGSGVLASIGVGLGMAGLSSGSGEVVVLDTGSLKQLARLPGGVFPDGIAYDPKDQRVFVSDELGGAIAMIDAVKDKVLVRIETGGEVGNVRYDAVSGKVFVPVQSHNALIAVDPVKGKVVARYPLPGCEHPHGLIIAPSHSVGYLACDEDDQLLTVDLSTGQVLEKLPVAHDPDVLDIDPELDRLYVAAESGTISVYDIRDADKPKHVGDGFVATGAHTVAVDPVSHRLYLALADLNGHAALRVLAPKR